MLTFTLGHELQIISTITRHVLLKKSVAAVHMVWFSTLVAIESCASIDTTTRPKHRRASQ